MTGLPERKIVENLPAFFRFVLGYRPRQKTVGCSWSMWSDGSGQRVVQSLRVRANGLHVSLGEPLARLLVEAGRVSVVRHVIGVVAMPTGIDDGNVSRLDLWPGFFEVFRSHYLPLLLRNRHNHTAPKECKERQFLQVGCAFDDVCRGIHVCSGMHDSGESL